MIKIGIECESIEESQTWGVAREINQLLTTIAQRPELGNEFKFFLYFKSFIPDYPYLKNPLFVCKKIRPPFGSFSLYYYLWLPLRLWFEYLDAVYFPNYMLPLIFRGRALVALTQDVYYEANQRRLPLRYRAAYMIFANWAAKRATAIMVFSESSKQAVSRLFNISPARIFVNHHGIQPPPAGTLPAWAAGKSFLLFVGQAFPRRRLKESLLAFEKIAPRFPNLHFVAVGKDKYRPPRLDQLADEINHRLGRLAIIRKEYVTDEALGALYRQAEALVYISPIEAFGLPPLEALASGTVSVVADSDTSRELFGENAFFVSQTDLIDSIAQTLTEALTNQAKRQQIAAAAGRILQRFTWPAHTDRFLGIIRETSRFQKRSLGKTTTP